MNFKSKLFVLTILMIIVSLCILPVSAEAKKITVGHGGLADYETIKEAEFWANDGDTIVVLSGTYNEKVEIQRHVMSNVATAHPIAAELRGMTCRRFTV